MVFIVATIKPLQDIYLQNYSSGMELKQALCMWNMDIYGWLLYMSLRSVILALHKAGRHMEDSIVAAYVALVVGCVIQHNVVSAQFYL